ncbi:hypothetical protein [Acinetobacter sp. ANC 4648]|uniref:hypothetical protein n=1 Tax=Acinetobacter sp. ANC 4648 TaxID=1977875 RepID=UPI000B55D0F4|nr:hypothetical protein [Acinetobacter sp. ANC 4648]OTG83829.1 hypothetical protein B9T27_04855 [Acinetobacter sp. ANC 4648]
MFSQKNASSSKYFIYSFLIITGYTLTSSAFAAEAVQKKWYRYYDKNGVANISTSVTPAHIRNGYEVLGSNMQVIQRNHAYSAEQDVKQSSSRASAARQKEQDAKLKRAYGNIKVAESKRNEQFGSIKKQIALQQDQLKQLQADRINFKRQEMEYFRKGSAVPTQLKNNIKYNTDNINNTKATIESLHTSYSTTQTYYSDIIQRLKVFE